MILRTTDEVITVLIGECGGSDRKKVKVALYSWRVAGKIVNHGGLGKGKALWDLEEVVTYARAYRIVYGHMPWQRYLPKTLDE